MKIEQHKITSIIRRYCRLRKLIIENPNLPLLFFVGDDAYSDEGYQYSMAYASNAFSPDDLIKGELDEFMDDIRKTINKTMQETFDKSTKDMLSSTVLSILTTNDTYRKIENNIKCIADKGN